MRHALIAILTGLVLCLTGSCAAAQTQMDENRFDGWATAIVAADWRDGAGEPIQAFDNAQRDMAAGFVTAGFSRADMIDVSLRPDVASPVTARAALEAIEARADAATGGCLLYFTSHGSPEDMVFGPDVSLTPTSMATLVRSFCGQKPTVVVVSACYSGIFLDGLSGPNRMVMTAARRDRNSFGCGADALYPYFDGCVIEALPQARDFIALANATRACVKRRETDEGLSPGSEPQVSIGADMQLLLPTLRFNRPEGIPGS